MSESPKRQRSRARGGDFFDFSPQPQPVAGHAADAVKREDLCKLFQHLDRIDEQLVAPGADKRQAALDALKAVCEFLSTSPFNTQDRFSRPLNLLWVELQNAPDPEPGEILPRRDPATSASTRKVLDHYIMACAAFAADAMHLAGAKLKDTYPKIVSVLEAHQFPFGAERDTTLKRADAVQAWRKGNAADTVKAHYKKMRDASPISTNHPWDHDKCEVVLRWLANELVRAGYE